MGKKTSVTPIANQRLVAASQRFATGAAISVALIGCLVFVGWQFDIGVLKSILPGLVTMKANTALSFILTGLALRLLQSADGRRARASIMAANVCALSTLALGGLTLSQDIWVLNLGIDELLSPDMDPVETNDRPRMSPAVALNFMLVGSALLLMRVETRRGYRPTELLIIPVLLISLLALIGYAYDLRPFYNFGSYSDMAVHTTLGFVLLGTAIFATRPDRGLMSLFTSDYLGGFLVRRLLPVVIVVPILLGWIGLHGQNLGLFNEESGLSLLVTTFILLFIGLVWTTARSIDRAHIEREEAEEVESVLQALLNAAPDATITVDPSGNIAKINQQVEQLFGYHETELIGRSIEILIPERFNTEHKVRAMAPSLDLLARKKDGTEVSVEVSLSPFKNSGAQEFTIAAIRDVTERKRVEEALVSGEMQMRLFMEATADCIWNWDLETDRVSRNSGFQKVFSYGMDEIDPGIDWWSQRLHPDDRERVCRVYKNAIESGFTTFSYEYRFRRRDGSYAIVHDRAFIIRDDHGKAVRALGAMTDITQRREADDIIRANEALIRAVLNSLTAHVAVLDRTGTILFVNAAWERFYADHGGLATVLGLNYLNVCPQVRVADSVNAEAILDLIRSVLSGERGQFSIEYSCHMPTGQQWFLLNVSPFSHEHGGAVVSHTDITVQKRAEFERDRLAKRLVDVQEVERRAVARDLHDEIGQKLTAIKLTLQLAQQTSVPTLIKDCMALADSVLTQVRDLSLTLHPAILEEFGLISALRWLAAHQAQRTGLVIEVVADPCLTQLEVGVELACFRISQEALTNVIRHAHAQHVSISLQLLDGNLELRIADDGIGFLLPRFDEPRTTSLGLLSMQERAQLVGGQLHVKSMPGHGTEVIGILPAVSMSPIGASSDVS